MHGALKLKSSKERFKTIETEMPAFLIHTKTEQPETQLDLKKELIKLLADPEIQKQLYEAIVTEDCRREKSAKIYE